MTPPKVVYVQWRDCTSSDAWMMPYEVEETACPIIHTCGFLTIEKEEYIGVSAAFETCFGKVAGTFTIPRAQIVSFEEVVWK